MALLVAKTDGTTNFMLDQAQVDLISITKVDSGLGFNEAVTTDVEGVTCVDVTFVQTETGPTPDRIAALVDETGFIAPISVVVFAVNDTFVTSDGFAVKGNGRMFAVGEAGNPFANNIAVFYDTTLCGGAGMWADKEGGGVTQFTTDALLFHELSHSFHFATDPAAAPGPAEEQAAEVDENLMRDVRGLPHREVTSHNGGCGGGPVSCCVVASLATGSPYSAEIGRFRFFREHVLRRSAVGDEFFAIFFERYYRFSPEICRLIAQEQALGPFIRDTYVAPLLGAVEMLVNYAEHGSPGIATFLRERRSVLPRDPASGTTQLSETLKSLGRDVADLPVASAIDSNIPSMIRRELASILRDRSHDDVICFALIDPIRTLILALSIADRPAAEWSGDDDNEIEVLIESWFSTLPISPVWGKLTSTDCHNELVSLGSLLRTPAGRSTFAARLTAIYPNHRATASAWASEMRLRNA